MVWAQRLEEEAFLEAVSQEEYSIALTQLIFARHRKLVELGGGHNPKDWKTLSRHHLKSRAAEADSQGPHLCLQHGQQQHHIFPEVPGDEKRVDEEEHARSSGRESDGGGHHARGSLAKYAKDR